MHVSWRHIFRVLVVFFLFFSPALIYVTLPRCTTIGYCCTVKSKTALPYVRRTPPPPSPSRSCLHHALTREQRTSQRRLARAIACIGRFFQRPVFLASASLTPLSFTRPTTARRNWCNSINEPRLGPPHKAVVLTTVNGFLVALVFGLLAAVRYLAVLRSIAWVGHNNSI